MKVSLEVVNVGSSPMYYDWPIQFTLLQEGRVRFRYVYDGFAISTVMPGDKWNRETRRYDQAPERYTIYAEFPVTGMDAGDYMLCVSIPDPNGGVPGLRFANLNYTNFGFTPLGWVGIGKAPDKSGLDGFEFGSHAQDDLFFRPR
jgi:hypothetical protein